MDKPRQMSMDDLSRSEKVYSILELNSAVRDTIKERFSKYVWVCGEIQDMRPPRGSGHIYFNCVEKDPDSDKTLAQVSAALFAGRVPKIFDKLKQADSEFKLKNDIEVKLLCQLDLYPKSGRFSIIVIDIDPVYTLGKIAQNRQKIIADLKARGLLQRNKEKLLPEPALKIGLITAVDSAAYHDFINELASGGHGFRVSVFGAHMQGKLVEPDVLAALEYFNSLDSADLDAVVITRGGGSTADLSYFDSRKIAEKIAALSFPVVAAVGHQINTTIIDLLAHTSCKTPTAAAQFLVERVQAFLNLLDQKKQAILEVAQENCFGQKQSLQNSALKFDSALSSFFRIQSESLLNLRHSILNLLKTYLQDQKNKVISSGKDLTFYSRKILKDNQNQLKHFSEKISLLDPKNILKRGYAVTYLKGKPIKSSKTIEPGDKIKTIFYQGWVESEVKAKDS